MNCLECVSHAEDGNLAKVKENQKTCTVFLNNQCNNYATRDSFDETIQDTLIEVNPKKWANARKIFAPALILIFALGAFLFTLDITSIQDDYMQQLGIAPSIVSENVIDTLRGGDLSSPLLFLYVSRNRHFSAFQQELEEYLYSFLPYAIEVTPSQAYQLEEQAVIILTGIVSYIQTSTLAETRVWISDGQDRETHSVIWYLNGDEISLSHIGREVRLLTVLEELGMGSHLRIREWILVSDRG